MTASLLFCLAFIPLNADAKEKSHQRLVYEVYAGGIHAVQATLNITINKNDRYDLVLKAHTRGFLGSLIPWQGTFESHGWIMKDKTFRPEMHKSTTGWDDEIDIKEYLYNEDGTFKSLRITDDHSDNELREVDSKLTNHSTDALTATLQVMHDYNQSNKCEGSAEVFDGKRRFKQSFKHKKNTPLEASKYNIYNGQSAECIVEVTPIAGEWHKKPRGWLSIQEQGRERGMMPTVWLGNLIKDAPSVPIKIRVKTAYGTLFMHLAEYQNDAKSIIAENRMKDEDK